MSLFRFIKLFWLIFNKNPKPDLKRIQDLGLLAVKIGQMYALRSDFLSVEKCRHLSKLYRQTIHLPPGKFQELYNRHAPTKLKNDIQSIEEKALASASVGQVHKATLKNGKTVVIKILKKDFKKKFTQDINAFKNIFRVALFFYPKLRKLADPIGTIETVERLTLTELNLINEIRGIEKLKSLKEKHEQALPYLKKLTFPITYEEYSNERVLVSDLIPGASFDEYLERDELDYQELLDLFRIHGFYLFLIGQFHGDLHPANIFLSEGKIVFLDNSNIEKVPPKFGHGILRLLKHLSHGEYDDVAQTLRDISLQPISDERFEKFREKINKLYKNFDQKTVSEISLTQKMMETVKTSIYAGMEFENGMFGVIKSLMYLDGMVIKCNPDAILLNDVKRFMGDFEKIQK
jgi:ubiquinone biosynthesis protein